RGGRGSRGHHRRARAALRAARALHGAWCRHARRRCEETEEIAEDLEMSEEQSEERAAAINEVAEKIVSVRHRAGFDATQAWIFDLDNTLYPAECNLFAQVDQKMGEFIANFLGVP